VGLGDLGDVPDDTRVLPLTDGADDENKVHVCNDGWSQSPCWRVFGVVRGVKVCANALARLIEWIMYAAASSTAIRW
jgi:hypothetical protein